ncbi:hypothetical protein Vadar_025796 [Vaccinium darrowii]|uniref:Uncharacterized protein n=1 Tax=Vaccinium darrowii TaxID=229202 RepID=A0ACB7YYK5_9ERIC|nr:hypothetical protein Vadar_025796 [Vaccinium darrowii]
MVKVQPSPCYIRLLKAVVGELKALEKSDFSVVLSLDYVILLEHDSVRFIDFESSKTKGGVIGELLNLIDKISNEVGKDKGLMNPFKEELKGGKNETLLKDPMLMLPERESSRDYLFFPDFARKPSPPFCFDFFTPDFAHKVVGEVRRFDEAISAILGFGRNDAFIIMGDDIGSREKIAKAINFKPQPAQISIAGKANLEKADDQDFASLEAKKLAFFTRISSTVQGLDDDVAPQVRKLYEELVELWPDGATMELNALYVEQKIARGHCTVGMSSQYEPNDPQDLSVSLEGSVLYWF